MMHGERFALLGLILVVGCVVAEDKVYVSGTFETAGQVWLMWSDDGDNCVILPISGVAGEHVYTYMAGGSHPDFRIMATDGTSFTVKDVRVMDVNNSYVDAHHYFYDPNGVTIHGNVPGSCDATNCLLRVAGEPVFHYDGSGFNPSSTYSRSRGCTGSDPTNYGGL